MGNQKKVILIPYWVQDILQRNQLQLADCLNLQKIKPLMSHNDLVGYVALQEYFKVIVGVENNSDLIFSLAVGIPESDTALRSYCYTTLTTMSSDATIHKEVKDRLFYSDCKSNHYEKPFNVYDLTPEVCGIVIYPGYFINDGNLSLQKAVIEAVLKVLYVYGAVHEVATTSFFKRHLELLTK